VADRCVCGHEEREHERGDAMGDECHACPCEDYRRSPLSSFRGPSVSFTREEAAARIAQVDWLTAAYLREGGPPRRMVREAAERARWAKARGDTAERRIHLRAALILRAVRS